MSEEKLVLEGRQVKVLTQARQVEAKAESGVIADYLRFTIAEDSLRSEFIPEDTGSQDLARLMALHFARLLGFTLGEDRPGRDYYDHTSTIHNANGHEVGSVSAGGEGQRGSVCFTLKGEGCTNARPGWDARVHEAFSGHYPKITRIDLARDFYDGEVTCDEMVVAYRDHAFSYQKRKPKCSNIGDWEHGNSRTFQVGKRESGKLCRGYEKDHQYGIMDGNWFRVEVELRSVNRVIPWDAVVRRAQYFAGAYEFCAWVAGHDVAVRIPTATKTAEVGVQAVVNWVKRVVAPTLVQIAGHMPDFDWLEEMVLAERNRPMPKSLRGFMPHNVQRGFREAFAKLSTNAGGPVACVS